MPDLELEKHPYNNPRYASMIDSLPIGESFSTVQRIDLAFGIGEDDRTKHVAAVRDRMDSMVGRSRKKHPGRKFTVETFTSLGTRGAVMFAVAVATRIS